MVCLDYPFPSYFLNHTWPVAASKMEQFKEDLDLYFYPACLFLFSDSIILILKNKGLPL